MKPNSAKACLVEYNLQAFKQFICNDDARLSLLNLSSLAWIATSKKQNSYTKDIVKLRNPTHKIRFITKNNIPYTFTWQTKARILKYAVRWGIVDSHSLTARTISTLGQYRLIAYKRIAKGIVSNSHLLKFALLDLTQDRFEALQKIESLLNKSFDRSEYINVFDAYIASLESIKEQIAIRFEAINQSTSGFDEETVAQLKSDIDDDIKQAKLHCDTIDSNAYQARTRGHDSTGEFIKQRMIKSLYQLQGINQDMTYSVKRKFALTRGLLNNYIEDARKGIEDHQADLLNSVTIKHHGQYSADDNQLVTYDFSEAQLTPQRKRDILLAISFIEECDNLVVRENSTLSVINNMVANPSEEKLDVIYATAWKTHRDTKTMFKSMGYYIKNSIASLFVATRPWEEEAWRNEQFHLFAKQLRDKIETNPAIWKKIGRTLRLLSGLARDFFKGITDFGADLVINMPEELLNDYRAATALPPLPTLIEKADQSIPEILKIEKDNLEKLFNRCDFEKHDGSEPESELALVEYHLNAGEQNDILTTISRGLYSVSSVLSHNIYNKDPLAGLVFTTIYTLGAGTIYLPSLTSRLTGPGYTQWVTNFSHSFSASQLGAAMAGGSMQAQAATLTLDAVTSGPSSRLMNTAYKIGEDPLTYSAYFACAYGLGYGLAHGVNGYEIPWFSKHCQHNLGTIPSINYPFIGGKVALMSYEAFRKKGTTLLADLPHRDIKTKREENQLLYWMLNNNKELPKLSSELRFDFSRHLDGLFEKKESDSLKKLLDKPKNVRSVARQTVFIPLTYFASLLRVIASILISFHLIVYKITRKENSSVDNPLKPFLRASKALLEKSWKDITRLYFFGKYIKDTATAFLTAMIKQIVYPTVMINGRLLAICGKKSAHTIYNVFSTLHNLQRSIQERFYPTHLLSAREVAEPAHTVMQIQSSYNVLMDSAKRHNQIKAQHHGIEAGASHHSTLPIDFSESKEPCPAEGYNYTL